MCQLVTSYNVGERRILEVGLQDATRDTGFIFPFCCPWVVAVILKVARWLLHLQVSCPYYREEEGEGEEKDTEFVPF